VETEGRRPVGALAFREIRPVQPLEIPTELAAPAPIPDVACGRRDTIAAASKGRRAEPTADPTRRHRLARDPAARVAKLRARLARTRYALIRANACIDGLKARQRELFQTIADLTVQATVDGLTGLKNRRHFEEVFTLAFALARRHGLPLSLVMIDVDWFKAFNDRFGHPAGDEVLRSIADRFRHRLREHDVVARYGGEEFVILLPLTNPGDARALAEQLRVAIADHDWPHREITISLGLASLTPETQNAMNLVEQADSALYHSKARGRNLATHFLDLLPEPAVDRDRGEPRGSSPPTPPGIRVRTTAVRSG
jgi:diguanylate cyclase (GGDEF)-like protein